LASAPRRRMGRVRNVALNGVVKFSDPQAYQAGICPAQVELFATAKGNFSAALTAIKLPRLWLQSGRETLPRVANAAVGKDRLALFFLNGADQAPTRHSGRVLAFDEIVASAAGSMQHLRTDGPCHWATLSMSRNDFTSTSYALAGRDLIKSSVTQYHRSPHPAVLRLLKLHQAAGQLAENQADILARPEPARALEQSLLHAMISCLGESTLVPTGWGALHHTTIVARFEELLAANYDRPFHLPEICAALDVSERTLRASCVEHLGMGPIRYLWLRRMHLAHRALVRTVPGTATVTDIATDNGFWELGRFAIAYRTLFGETPSTTLRRPAEHVQTSQEKPFSLIDSEYA
jgi:AraC-like DNA-binding protein